jgi:RHS repeat-associated protein
VTISHVYPAVYYNPTLGSSTGGGDGGGGGGGGSTRQSVIQPVSFAQRGLNATGNRAREEIEVVQQYTTTVNVNPFAETQGIGGWTIDAHHVYDPEARQIYLGDGTVRSDVELGSTVEQFWRDARRIWGLDIGPDGSVYRLASKPRPGSSIQSDVLIERRTRDGTETVIGGTTDSSAPFLFQTPTADVNDQPATSFQLIGSSMTVTDEEIVYFGDDRRIYRLDRDGLLTVIGGQLTTGSSGDGGPATAAEFEQTDRLTWAPDGSLYFLDVVRDSFNRIRAGYLRRIRPDGVIEAVTRTRTFGSYEMDEFPAVEEFARVDQVSYSRRGRPELDVPFAVGPDGTLYLVLGERFDYVYAVETDGSLRRVAGAGEPQTSVEYDQDGSLATEFPFGFIQGVTVGPTGTIYTSEQLRDGFTFGGGAILRQIGTGGRVRTLAGGFDGESVGEESVLATDARIAVGEFIAVSPDGTDVVFRNDNRPFGGLLGVYAWRSGAVGVLSGGQVPSRDGEQIYEFAGRRHVLTLDAQTGKIVADVDYTADGLPSSLTDENGAVTTVEYDGTGASARAITFVAPDGRRTELAYDGDDLASVTDPTGAVSTFAYTDGLLTSVTDPTGGETTFGYGSGGRLELVTNPEGGETDLLRSADRTSASLVRIAPDLAQTTYAAARSASGERTTSVTCCGDTTTTVVRRTGLVETSFPDGRTRTQRLGVDPRYGAFVPFTKQSTLATPGGRSRTDTRTTVVEVGSTTHPLGISRLTNTRSVGGRPYVTTYDDSARELTIQTPEGRTRTARVDADGRRVEERLDGQDPVTFDYDTAGNLTSITQGGVTLGVESDATGRVTGVTAPTGARVSLVYDDADRVTGFTTPSGESVAKAFDDAGNLVSLTTPNGDVHTMTYTPGNRLSSYTTPGGDSLVVDYGLEGRVAAITHPSGRSLDLERAPGGRVTRTTTPEATIEREFVNGQLVRATRTPDGESPQTVSFGHDGHLVTEQTYAGAADGTFTYSYATDLRPGAVELPDGTDWTLAYDDDDLPTRVGPFGYSRDGPDGAVTVAADRTFRAETTHEGAGLVASRTFERDGAALAAESYSYDDTGALVERTRTVNGTTSTDRFSYDADGSLTGVERDGSMVEAYEYDPNGNRTLATVRGGTPQSASYDASDRIESLGTTDYVVDADGNVVERGSTTFEYGTTGELLSATVGSETITYGYDAFGRRVTRTDSAGTVEYLYGDLEDVGRITAVRETDRTLTHYHYDGEGRVVAIERGGSRSYVLTDQVGTPWRVVAADGTVEKEVDRDAFGVVHADSNPGFVLHLGFAGGLDDATTGLVRFGRRDYDTVAGRWTARDPLLFAAGQTNLYVYVLNDPVGFVDPTGLAAWGCWWEGTTDSFVDTNETIANAFFKSGRVRKMLKNVRAGPNAAPPTPKAAALRFAQLAAAFEVGVAIGSAIDPFRDNSLGETLGQQIYDWTHDKGTCVKNGPGEEEC